MSTETLVVLESPSGARVLAQPLATDKLLVGVTGDQPVPKTLAVALGGSSGSATPVITAEVRSAAVEYTAPIAPSANAGAATLVVDVTAANGPQVVAAQPDVPRKLLVFVTDANASISAGTLDLAGTDASGAAVSESIALTGGTATKTTTKAYASFTASIAGLVGGAVGDKIAVGVSGALGLPGCKTPAATTYGVHKTTVDGTHETAGTVDAAAGTVTPLTAPNGTRRFGFWYTYAVQPVQAAHTHTIASGTATPSFS